VRVIQAAVVLIGLTIVVLFVLWAIPGLSMASSDDYAVFKQRVERDGMLRTYLGGPVRCERVPTRYGPGLGGGTRFTAVVSGGMGRAVVSGQVRDGKVVRFRKRLAVDWSRPLLEALGPRRP
jgi:hypothetical protein